jgi:hypothetical protein
VNDEEARAKQFRTQERRLAAARRQQLVKLAGSKTAARELRDAWKPLFPKGKPHVK